MKLSRILEAAEVREAEPVLAPSAVHVAFVRLLGQLSLLGNQTGHPAAKLMARLLPSMLRDIADIPAESLSRLCCRVGEALVEVGHAEDGAELPALAALAATGEGDGAGPDQPSLAERARG